MVILQRQTLPFKDRWAVVQLRGASTWTAWWRDVVYLVRG